MSSASQVLVSVVSGVFVAAVASAVTAHLAFRRFYSERWWERKAAAYTELIEALYRLYDLPVTWLHAELAIGKAVSDEEEAELMKRYEAADRAVSKAVAVGNFVVSERAVTILRDLRRRQVEAQVDAEQRGAGVRGLLEGTVRAAQGTLEALRAEARRDLGVEREF